MESRELELKFAGRLIDLLGQQMYGGPVPSVAELIANAWDADATRVEITIPDNIKEEGAEIIVKDYGIGMTFDELNNYYLNVGYERRKLRGEKTVGGRNVMGRKGIGKLAGFGIAEDISIKSVKDGHLVQFNLNYTNLRKLASVANFKFRPDIDKPSNEPNGVTVTFKNLKLDKAININSFRTSMSRRFAIGSDKMAVVINDNPIIKEDLTLEHREPEEGWNKHTIEGFGEIEYWFGFLTKPIDDSELRGITVFARERVAQFTPFTFNLSGGINGQLGLEYLTGQIKADALDENIDLIATDRQTVNWQFPKAQKLEIWGQQKIKQLCSEWKKRKDEKNLNKFKHSYSEYNPRIEVLPLQEKKDIYAALEKIATLDRIEEAEFKIIANSMIAGVERESVKKVIRKINTASDNALPELFEAIKEWDIISAVSTAEVVFGKLEIIDQFKSHIKNRLPEKSPGSALDMQKFIKAHPWLLGPEYEQLSPADFHHERGVDKWIEEIIIETDTKEFSRGTERENKRFDLVCVKNNLFILVLELMRPGQQADYDHASRLVRYVTRIKDGIANKGTHERYNRMSVFGILLADSNTSDGSLREFLQTNRNTINFNTWTGMFEEVESRYKDFFDVLKEKAPEDPRIKGLVNL